MEVDRKNHGEILKNNMILSWFKDEPTSREAFIMKMLSIDTLKKMEIELNKIARPLECAMFDVIINNGSINKYLEELKKFQLDDGGFGFAIEPDLRLASSCPISTSVGIRNALKFEKHPASIVIVKKALEYLVKAYDKDRIGWYAGGKEINDYPHSPWWHWQEDKKMTAIDENWGNPSAELLGYILSYEEYAVGFNFELIRKKAIENIYSITDFVSFHELYCYAYLIEKVDNDFTSSLLPRVEEGISVLVEKDSGSFYRSYAPTPLDFINKKEFTYGISKKLIDLNLDILIERLEQETLLTPHWDWNDEIYKGNMESARNEWKGILTVQAIEKLMVFNRMAE